MTSLTFYGGVKEIGGNKILLEDGDTRVFLDFGMSFGLMGEFYDSFLGPKKCNGVGDYIELGMVPEMKGIYRQDYLKKMGRPEEKQAVDGVIVSHAHMDHIGMISLLRADIPLYCSPATKSVMQMLDETGNSEYLTQKRAFQFYTNKKGGISRMTAKHEDGTTAREVHEVTKKFKVGSLEVTPFPVDHSLPGATAFAIETSAGVVVYTGDLRFHGRRTTQSLAFVEKAKALDPTAIITEGTRIDAKKTETEEDVYKTVTNSIGDSGLAIANYPVRDTDRMESFVRAADDNGRRLAVNMKQAYLLDLFEQNKVAAPRLSEVDIYVPRKSWCLITEKDIDPKLVDADYKGWERGYIRAKNAVTAEDIHKQQSSYIWRSDFFEMKEMMDVRPGKGSHYIWSLTEPFNVSMKLDKELIMHWLKHFGIDKITEKHVSGHACGPELRKMLEEIAPKQLFPVHTEHPGMFRSLSSEVRMIKYGKRYEV